MEDSFCTAAVVGGVVLFLMLSLPFKKEEATRLTFPTNMPTCAGAFLLLEDNAYDIVYEPPRVVRTPVADSVPLDPPLRLSDGERGEVWQTALQKNCFAAPGATLLSQDSYPDSKVDGCIADCERDGLCDYLVFNDRQNTCLKYSVTDEVVDLSSSSACRADGKYATHVKPDRLCLGCDA